MIGVKIGTNRLVLISKKLVYKIPLFSRGRRANLQEYHNYLRNADIVARTEKRWYGLRQERLAEIHIFPRYATLSDIRDDMKPLFKRKLHNRFQVGRGENGKWLFFDYEDVKYYERNEDEENIKKTCED